MKPAHDWMDKLKKNLLLGPSEQFSVKYISISPIFMRVFSKVSDTTKMLSRMKWVNSFKENGH